MRVILPELAYIDDRFMADMALTVDEQSGRIVDVVPADQLPSTVHGERCVGCAMLPGMVNAHSHAFQRAIRGWTQWRPPDERADFWSWRTAMYQAVQRLSPGDVYRVSRFCFIEMLLAGYTTVGEFHYLQRDPRGQAYADPNELALQVVRAAQDVGIRIVLLNVAYVTGGINEELRPEQRRFATPDLDAFLQQTDALQAQLRDRSLASAGIAPHSVRAVPRSWLQPIAECATERGLPLHMHVSEQPAEVESCLQHYGVRPIELLDADGILSQNFTGIHATHVSDGEVAALGRARASVCACPSTERDLGDGVLRALELSRAGARLCIGSDSQTIIDPWEELRLLEYHARLALLRRVILAEEVATDRLEVAPVLLRAASAGGANALGLSGSLTAGQPADFVMIDLEHPALAGWNKTTLGALLALSAPAAVVRDVWVGGVPRVRSGQHDGLPIAQPEFNQVCKRVLQ